jgi:hypothetical protein
MGYEKSLIQLMATEFDPAELLFLINRLDQVLLWASFRASGEAP